MRENGTICPGVFFFFFFQFYSIFASELDIFPLKRSVFWRFETACLLGVEKDKWRIWAPRPPITAEMPTKQESQQDHNWPHHIDWPQIGQK